METKRILYYADPSFPDVLRQRLEARGYELGALDDGQVLYERAALERPDLVIAYARMPQLGGLDLCLRVQQNHALRDTVVLVLSENQGNGRQEFYSAGCDGYYQAPFDDVGIAQRIDELMHDRSSARRLSIARLALDYKVNSEVLSITPQELHEGTLFLHGRSPLEEGSRLKLTLSMAGKTLIDAHGEVVRSEPFRGFSSRPSGMAVRLYDLDADSFSFLEALTRQRLLAGRTWDGVDLQALMARIIDEISSGAAPGPQDALLMRAGFDRRALRSWEVAAFESPAQADRKSAEIDAAVREAVGLIYKLNYHIDEFKSFVCLSEPAAERMRSHAEKVLRLAETSGDRLTRLSGDLASEGSGGAARELAGTQADILQRMVELRTVIAEVGSRSAHSQPSLRSEDLCTDNVQRLLVHGLCELFDFTLTGTNRESAKKLNADLDLSELSHFEVTAFMESSGRGTTVLPDIQAWVRAIVARHIQLDEFLRYRRPDHEIRADRVAEVVDESEKALDSLIWTQKQWADVLKRWKAHPAVSETHLAELAASNHRMLVAATRLYNYYRIHVEKPIRDYQSALTRATRIPHVLGLVEGEPAPLPFPDAPSDKKGSASEATGANKGKGTKGSDEAQSKPARSIGALLRSKAVLATLGIAVLCVGGFGIYIAFSGPSARAPDLVNVRPYQSILPLRRCQTLKATLRSGAKKRTLRCVVRGAWTTRKAAQRKRDVRRLRQQLRRKGMNVNQILLLDSGGYTLAFADETEVEVFER